MWILDVFCGFVVCIGDGFGGSGMLVGLFEFVFV